ncbi:multidrug effflux MFS transporter [Pacificimonas sp. WHA3]|uniref:Bcr/CflA family efflux transporter n=1 Tax=Pacificimonas pallii TaxID=2827236 RepID=A0ABS6SGT4_9SPHN|nr:multidrug effflux MFS transporter [Pacificimonas pallii]
MNERARPAAALIILLGGLTAFGPLSIDLYLPALPVIGESLGTDAASMQRTLASFIAGLAIGQLVYGPLSDRIGRRPPLLIGIAIFIVTCVLCVYAESNAQMTALRFVQGLGSCAALVVARAIVRDRFNHQDSARVFTWIVLVMGIAPIFAPLLGSLILSVAEWTAIFWVLALYGVLLGAAVLFGLSESRSAETAELARSARFFGGMSSLIRNRRFRGYMFGQAFNMASLFAYVSSAPAILIVQYGVSEFAFGWLFALNAAGLIAGSQVNRYLLDHYSADAIMRTANQLAVAAGFLLLGAAFTGFGGLFGIMTALFLVLATYGFIAGNANAGGLSVDPRRAGAASALLGAAGFGVGAASAAATSFLPLEAAQSTAIVCVISLILSWWLFRGTATRSADVSPREPREDASRP